MVPTFQQHRKNETESLGTEYLDKVRRKKRIYAVFSQIAYVGLALKTAEESVTWLAARLNIKPEKLHLL